MKKLFTRGLLIIIAIVLAASISGCISTVPADTTVRESPSTGTSPESTPSAPPPALAQNSNDLRDISNYWVKIEGTTANVGDTFSKLAADFGIDSYYIGDVEDILEPNESRWISFEFAPDMYLQVLFQNLTNENMQIMDCAAISIELEDEVSRNFDNSLDISFFGGLRIGISTRKEAEALFGTPNYDSVDGDYWIGMGKYYIEYDLQDDDRIIKYELWFTFDDILLGVSMQYYYFNNKDGQ